MMLASMLQESGGKHRLQLGGGPGHGLWQFEEGGAVHGVLCHHATSGHAMILCIATSTMCNEHAVWLKLAHNDILAAGLARLLLYTHPQALPELDAPDDETWEYYRWLWRPGKPRRDDWPANHAAARAQVLT
jgi:hypothetical protein